MSFELIRNLIYNASFLLVLGLVSVYVTTGKPFAGTKMKILAGLMNGFICVVIMSSPVQIISGLAVDSSSILLGVTTMFFGLEPALANLFVIIAGRILLGGTGTLAGIITADIIIAAGLLWNKYRLQTLVQLEKKPWAELSGMGVVFAAVQLLGLMASTASINLISLVSSWLPAVIVCALGSLFISMVAFTRILAEKQKVSYTEALIETVNENLDLKKQLDNSEVMRRSLFVYNPVIRQPNAVTLRVLLQYRLVVIYCDRLVNFGYFVRKLDCEEVVKLIQPPVKIKCAQYRLESAR
jgi:hypothetical protein